MKRKMLLIAPAVILGIICMSSAVWADSLPIKVGDLMQYYEYNHTNNAGIINFYVNNISTTYDTFRAQQSITIGSGWHKVSATDKLNSSTAYKADYLFSLWKQGNITLVNDSQEADLQTLIWDYLSNFTIVHTGGFYDTLNNIANSAVQGTSYGTYLISFEDDSQKQLEW